jgi:hypothetical protein
MLLALPPVWNSAAGTKYRRHEARREEIEAHDDGGHG